MSESSIEGPIPRHTYEMVDGTKPTTYGIHDPRKMVHTVTTGEDVDLFMMTEIGDGVFVQWTNCRTCGKRVGLCKCPGGPTEPHYMKPWRDNRFERSMEERPEPDYKLIPKLIGWVRERGYTVTKKGEKVEVGDVPIASYSDTTPNSIATEMAAEAKVTAGIDAAIDAVKPPEKKLEQFDVDF